MGTNGRTDHIPISTTTAIVVVVVEIGLEDALSHLMNVGHIDRIHAVGIPAPLLNVLDPTVLGRIRRQGCLPLLGVFGLVRIVPTIAHIGLTFNPVPKAGTIGTTATGFPFDGVVQQQLQFFPGVRFRGQQVPFDEFFLDPQHFEASVVGLFATAAGREEVDLEFATRTSRVALTGSLKAELFEFVPDMVDADLSVDIIVLFRNRSRSFAMLMLSA